MSRLPALATILAALAGCASPQTPAQIPCSGDSQCPTGQICIGGLCATPVSSDGGRLDGGLGADGGQDGGTADGGALGDGGAGDGGVGDGGVGDGGSGGAFGDPCQSNQDCQSGVCIQTPQRNVCTKPCSQDCPSDWGCRVVSLQQVCVPPELTVCATCADDADCGGLYRCTTWAGARVCLRACGAHGDCGSKETCRAIAEADGGAAVGDGGVGDGGAEGRCVPTGDANHCGACGSTCVGGAGVQCCGDRCVDLLTEESMCGTSCGAAQACAPGNACCGGSCVDPQTSDTHCGACLGEGGQTCAGADAKCCGGTCVSVRNNPAHCGSCAPCPAGQDCCGLACTDLATDPGNCTACGTICQPAQACCGSDACTALADNDRHCGACNNDCAVLFGAAGNCCGNTCRDKLNDPQACGDGCAACGGAQPACCSGTCADLATDEAHCGACSGPGTQCAPGQTCCAGGCTSTQSDGQNCGACGTKCGAGLTCCGGQCKNLQTDPLHCGACGNDCANNGWANVQSYGCAGTCTIAACIPTFHNLDGVATNGCECQQDGYEPNNFSLNAAPDTLPARFNLNPNGVSDAGYDIVIQANLVPGGDNDFFFLYVDDETDHDFDMNVTLSNIPAGANYDLYVYVWDGAEWSFLGASQNGGNADEFVNYGGCGLFCNDDGWYGFEVRYVSGPRCGSYQLRVQDD